MSKVVLVPLATGFEEIEAVSIIDVLKRAEIEVLVASLSNSLEVQGANGITIKANIYIKDVDTNILDMVVLPGGWGGTDILANDKEVQKIIKTLHNQNRLIGEFVQHHMHLIKQVY